MRTALELVIRRPGLQATLFLAMAILLVACNNGQGGSGY